MLNVVFMFIVSCFLFFYVGMFNLFWFVFFLILVYDLVKGLELFDVF